MYRVFIGSILLEIFMCICICGFWFFFIGLWECYFMNLLYEKINKVFDLFMICFNKKFLGESCEICEN